MRSITPAAMQAAREWFAQNCLDCIFEAAEPNAKWRVNDFDSYADAMLIGRERFLMGHSDHTFAMRQYAWYIQTGESVALLP